MNIWGKLSWRAKLLQSKLLGREIVGWKDVLREIFRSHSSLQSVSFSFADDGDLLSVMAPNGVRCFWPKEYDPTVLNILYDEIFGPKGCIYELPGKVEVKPGYYVIDGGACEGFFSLYCLMKGAFVLAVEPNPRMAQALEKTLRPYIDQGKAKVFQVALGERRGEAELAVDSQNVGGSSCVLARGSSLKVRVPVIPLDDLVQEAGLPKVDFIKLDVEGAEGMVIRGTEQIVYRHKPLWAIACYHRKEDSYVLPQLLQTLSASYHTFTKGAAFVTLREGPPYLRPLVFLAYTNKNKRS